MNDAYRDLDADRRHIALIHVATRLANRLPAAEVERYEAELDGDDLIMFRWLRADNWPIRVMSADEIP